MLPDRLEIIKEECNNSFQQATKIMDGGDNYDGADGAREVIFLCKLMQELISALETNIKK